MYFGAEATPLSSRSFKTRYVWNMGHRLLDVFWPRDILVSAPFAGGIIVMKRVNRGLNTKKFEKAEFVGQTEQMTETAESG